MNIVMVSSFRNMSGRLNRYFHQAFALQEHVSKMSPDHTVRVVAVEGDSYDETYERRAAAGEEVHGEANFVQRFSPSSVLDAGCGTGRVGRELARRGVDVAGVDIDPEMLRTARRKAPGVDWHLADLVSVDFSRSFDVIVMAGNVMIFLTPGTEDAVIANMARHLQPGGVLIAGFQIMRGGLTIQRYDEIATSVGLTRAERWSTWDRDAWDTGSDYAVSVHREGQAGSRVRR